MITDEQFNADHRPLPVPAHFHEAIDIQSQVVYTLAQLGQATSDEVTLKLKELTHDHLEKPDIAQVHQVLTNLYSKGQLAGHEENGELNYNLHKITEANDGKVSRDSHNHY